MNLHLASESSMSCESSFKEGSNLRSLKEVRFIIDVKNVTRKKGGNFFSAGDFSSLLITKW